MGRNFGGRKRKREGGDGKGKKGKGKGGRAKGKGGEGGKRRGSGGPAPLRAVLVTSGTPSQCPKATREAVSLLEAARTAMCPAADQEAADEAAEGRSIGESLEAELQALRGEDGAKAPKRPIRFHSEVSRGVAILTFPGAEEDPSFPAPSDLVGQVFAAQREGGSDCQAARFVVRMAPLDYVCSPHLKNFQAAAAAALPKALADAKEGAGWYCAFHSRAMTTIKRQDALETLKEILGPLKLDLSVSDAEYMIVIEVNPTLCGFSVLRNYEGTLHECNLQKACKEYENRVAEEQDHADEDDEDDDGDDDEDEDEDGEA